MNIFHKLFDWWKHRGEPTVFIVKIPPSDGKTTPTASTDDNNSRAKYYVNMFLDSNEVKQITEKQQYIELLSNFPDDKVIVFVNTDTLIAMSEKHFIALDEYIASAKDGNAEKTFYRGLRGVPICCAFPKYCIPDAFDGSIFGTFPMLALYF